MNAHFFDLATLIESNSKVWIVSKTKPSIPLVKISIDEFNLIRKGVYTKYNQKIRIGNSDYWFSQLISDELKIKCVKTNTNITDLSFSMQEFMNPEIIEKIDFTIHKDTLINLKNSDDDIYIICSKNTKRNYEPIIKKLEEYLNSIGLFVKNYYFISETFFNRDEDDICHKKVRLLLQHLVGIKTDDDKFTNEQITKYQTINFYDDSFSSIEMAKNINDTLTFILSNSEKEITESVKTYLKDNYIQLLVNLVTFNRVNKFVTVPVKLSTQNIIKTFESFRFRN